MNFIIYIHNLLYEYKYTYEYLCYLIKCVMTQFILHFVVYYLRIYYNR